MDRHDDGVPDRSALARAATARARALQRSALHGQALSDRDQGHADADQTSADEDQAGSERDDADAVRDQHAADIDQARADEQRPAADAGPALDAWIARQRARDETRIDRLATHAAREGTARDRLSTAADRDATAEQRDEAARRREERAAARDAAIASSDLPADERIALLLTQAAAARAGAAGGRRQAAADRERAARERASFAAERERLERDLRSAHVDALTGALRREIGWLMLTHEIERVRRGDGRLVVAFVDVDDMKGVNDRGGHAAGDRVLQGLVWQLRQHLRPYDPIIRYGGDEFVCGLPGLEADDAQLRFSVIATAVHDVVGVGITVGIAQLAAVDTLDALTGRADAALLDANRLRGF